MCVFVAGELQPAGEQRVQRPHASRDGDDDGARAVVRADRGAHQVHQGAGRAGLDPRLPARLEPHLHVDEASTAAS